VGSTQPSQPLRRRSTARSAAVLLAALLSLSSLIVAPGTAAARSVAPNASSVGEVQPSAPAHHLSAEVVGYLPYWEMKAATFSDIDLTKVSSIVLFSIGWDGAGHLVIDAPGYRAITRSDTTAFVSAAKAAGVRVLLSFTSFGATKNAAFFASPTARANFVTEAAAFVAARGLDGADLDVELISGTYFDAYASTAGALRTALRKTDPDALVTVATNGNVSGARMAAKAIAAGADRAFLMGYAYRTAGSAPGVIDPLSRTGTSLSLNRSLDLYVQYGAPLNRVILGLPLYGRSWPTQTASVGSPIRTGIPNTGAAFFLEDLATMRATAAMIAEDYVPLEEGTRLVRSVSGVIWQSFYDSKGNLETKMRVVLQRGLAGAGLWALGYSTGRPEYWTAIGNVFGAPTITGLAIRPSPTNTRTVSVRVAWRDNAAPATGMRIANGSGSFSPWRPIATATPWTLPTGPSVVRRTVRVQLRNGAGATSPIASTSVLYDHARPTMTKLTVTWSATARAWMVRYAGKDVGSGVAGYKIVLKRNGVWTTLAMTRTTTTYRLRLGHSARFVIGVMARDRAGNLSAAAYSFH
jgi:GH18 family chitinase